MRVTASVALASLALALLVPPAVHATQSRTASTSARDASDVAIETGAPVEVTALTSTTDRTFALPDGTYQTEMSSIPVRARLGDHWVDVDTDLELVDGWWAPRATAAPVRFSNGGTGMLAQVQTQSGTWVSEIWPGEALPEPVIEGDTATYPGVFDGVDLKMVATSTGAASVYVVKTAEAAAALESLQIRLDGAVVEKTDAGRLIATADDGSILYGGAPFWWDSSDGGTYRSPGLDADPIPAVQAVEGDTTVVLDVPESLSIRPTGESNARMLEDPDTDVNYPIFVDPDWSASISSSWYTDAAYPNQSYLSVGADSILRVGNYAPYQSDMFFSFDTTGLAGKQILSAVLNTTQLSVNACGVQGIGSHVFGPLSPGFTWNQEQAAVAAGTTWWGSRMQSWVGPDCGSAAMAVGYVVTSGMQAIAGLSNYHIAFTPLDPYAPTRRHYSRAATLIITYNTVPNVPTSPIFSAPNAGCPAEGEPAWISNAGSLALQASITDADAQNVMGRFRVVDRADGSVVWQKDTAFAAQGNHQVSIPGGTLADGNYVWEAQSIDPTWAGSTWSARCFFNVRSTGPDNLPVIDFSSGPYTVGEPVSVTFTTDPDDGVEFIAYATVPGQVSDGFVFDVYGDPPVCDSRDGDVRIVCPDALGTAVSTFAPTAGTSTVWAVSYDKAGNPARVAGKPVAEAGEHGVGMQLNAANDSAVSFAEGHAWRTLVQPSPLGDEIPDTNVSAPMPLVLGKDTLRSETANPLNPSVPISKPVLGFIDPSTSTLSGPDVTASETVLDNARESFTMAAWIKPDGGSVTTAISVTSGMYALEVGASATAWRVCAKRVAGLPLVDCESIPRASDDGWAHIALVVDAGNYQRRLFVDGQLMSTKPYVWDSYTWSGDGPAPAEVVLARPLGALLTNDRWAGLVADPAVFAGVATESQINYMRNGQDPANG